MATWRGHIAGGIGAYLIGALAVAALAGIGVWQAGPPMGFYRLLPPELWSSALMLYHAGLLYMCLLFSLFPDIDTRSKGRKVVLSLFLGIEIIFLYAQQYLLAALLALLIGAAMFARHRSWTHRAWAAVLIPCTLVGTPFLLAGFHAMALICTGAAVIGYMSHLAMDGMLLLTTRR